LTLETLDFPGKYRRIPAGRCATASGFNRMFTMIACGGLRRPFGGRMP
jgi:hypothetical protein